VVVVAEVMTTRVVLVEEAEVVQQLMVDQVDQVSEVKETQELLEMEQVEEVLVLEVQKVKVVTDCLVL
jgi:hypothetical protein